MREEKKEGLPQMGHGSTQMKNHVSLASSGLAPTCVVAGTLLLVIGQG
jgi:hypothetical protein